MISQLREPIRPIRAALARPLVMLGVSPNTVTLAALPFSGAAAYCVAQGWVYASVVFALLAALMDFLDGEVARLQNRESAYGNYLEAVVDRWVDGMLLLGFCPQHCMAAGLGIILGGLVSYTKARLGLVMPIDNRDWPGWGDRSDRLLLLLPALLLGTASRWCELFLWAVVIVSAVGCFQRLQHARKQIEEAGL